MATHRLTKDHLYRDILL